MAYELPAEGNYKGKIVNWGLGESRNGKPFVHFEVYVTEREDEGEMMPLEKSFTASVDRYLSESALPSTMNDLLYLGYKHKSLVQLSRKHPEAFNFAGIEVFVRCTHEEYMGKVNPKWNIQRRKKLADETEIARILKSTEDAFAAEMAKALGETPEASEEAEGLDQENDLAGADLTAGRF